MVSLIGLGHYMDFKKSAKFIADKAWAILAILALFAAITIGIRACSHRGITQVYRVTWDNNWSVAASVKDKQHELVAFINELIFQIASTEQLQIQIVPAASANLFNTLEQGDYDAVLSFWPSNGSQKRKFIFSDPLYVTGLVLVVKNSSNITSLKQMEGKTVGITTGMSIVFNTDQYPPLLITSYESAQKALADVDRNIIDGAIMDMLMAYIYINGPYAGKLKVLSPLLSKDGLRAIARRDPSSEYFIQTLNKGLEQAKKNGTYQSLIRKWGLYSSEN